jgi:integrase
MTLDRSAVNANREAHAVPVWSAALVEERPVEGQMALPIAAMDSSRAILAWVAHMRLCAYADCTIRVCSDHLIRLARFLRPKELLSATHDDLLRWAQEMSPLAPRTRYSQLSRVHSFYTWAYNDGLISDVPSARIPRPKVPLGIPRPISEDGLQAALDSAPPDIFAWLTLAAYAGLRACEIASLTRDSIREHDDPPMLVVTGKGSKDRVIPLHPAILPALRAYGLPNRGWIFHRRDDVPGHPTRERVSWLANRYLHDIGIDDTLHSLRHRAITQVYRQSHDIRVAQSFAGHSSPQTTAGYAAYSPALLVSAVLAMPTRESSES